MNAITKKIILVAFILPLFLLAACKDTIADQLKEEVATLKSQCPADQGNGVTMKDVNFYEGEKVLEYVCSLEGVESIDASIIQTMKAAMVESLKSNVSEFGKLSVKVILEQYDYRFRYIYEDTDGNKLCQIEINKYDL